MKKISYFIIAIIFSMIASSCEKEEIIVENPRPQDSIPTVIDSSLLEHNMVYNGHYYLLEFDTAYADLTESDAHITGGGGPSTLAFRTVFTDQYTHHKFTLTVGVGQVSWSNTNYEIYYAEEAQDALENAYEFMYEVLIYSEGLKFHSGIYSYGNLLKNLTHLTINTIAYNTYYQGQDKWADYHLIIHSDQLELNVNGKLKAQHDEH